MIVTIGGCNMNQRKRILRYLQFLTCLMLVLYCYSAYAAESPAMPVGTQLPKFTIGTPDSPETQKYLGLKDDKPFTLSDIGAKLVIIEFLSAL
jgi:hypothetical protein